MANKPTRMTIDGISYDITEQGARKISKSPPAVKKKKPHSKTPAKHSIVISTPVVVVVILRMLFSLRFLIVLSTPIILLIVVKTMQLNSYELAQTVSNWFSSSNLNNLRFIAASTGIFVLIGWLLEPWLLKLSSANRPPYWQLVGGLIVGTTYFVLLMALALIIATGLSTLVINKLYSFLPVLAVFVVICLWAITIIGILWCWACRNRNVLRFARSAKVGKLLLVPIIPATSPLSTLSQIANRLLPATITLAILVFIVSFETLLLLSGLSSGWQVLGLVMGICLSIAVLSFDHLQKHKYWLPGLESFTKLRRYPSTALLILGIDSFLLACVLVGIIVQVALPKAFDYAHSQSIRLKKLVEQSNLEIPSAKQVKPFDNNTKNK